MKRLALTLLILFGLFTQAEAASRFWVPLTVTGAVSGTGGLCRLTVNDTTNLTAGDAVIVAGIVGATACDGTTTVTTVVSSTLVEVNLAFGLAYTSGGTVAGGNWTATGTGNWSATSGGAGGQSVPGSADTVTFNGSSGGGTVKLNFGGTITIQSLNIGSFTGTFDNSVNNNNFVITAASSSAVDNNGSGTRTITLGTATYTLSGAPSGWTSGASGLTLNATSSTIAFTGTTSTRTFSGGNKAYGTVTYAATTGGGAAAAGAVTQIAGGSIASLVLNAPIYVTFQTGGTSTVTSFTANGSSSNQIYMTPDSTPIPTVAVTTASLSWVGIHSLTFTGSPAATSSFNLGAVTGITITGPVAGGGIGCILGGWLLWRDMPEHLNDNFPAWLDKAA